MNCRIIRSRLIYKWDTLNKTNFHKYVDGIQNLVVIIKLANGNFLAAYTEDSFQPKKTSQGEGLIISLTRQEVFTLIERRRRAITYDDYFLIFGNSQVRLRSGQNKVFSNFAISNSYFNPRGKRVSDILGGSIQERELEFQYYEVYQIILNFD